MEPSLSNSSSLTSSSSHVNNTVNTSDVWWLGMNIIPFRLRSPISVVMACSSIMCSTPAPIPGAEARPRPQVQRDSGSGDARPVELSVIGAWEQGNVGAGTASELSPAIPLGPAVRCGDGTMRPFVFDQGIGRFVLDEETHRRLRTMDPPLDHADISDMPYWRESDHFVMWVKQVLPFFILLLAVFIRQHLCGIPGFFVSIFVIAVMLKSNEIVQDQTSRKEALNAFVLVGISFTFMLYVIGIYWCYRSDGLSYPLAMLPPKETVSFWRALFIILVNDALVRQAAMALKCLLLLIPYKSDRDHSFRQQAQILTLVEYTLLLYRNLLPTPVWYRFFSNKDYGPLFSALTTGLYLIFKLITLVRKIRLFSTMRALSETNLFVGGRATRDQVNAAGDMCTICQEKMCAPISLSCKHVFCEDCAFQWFARGKTCPLCRAVIKPPADLKTFGDGSTTLFFQLV